jgi:hypothetical protein
MGVSRLWPSPWLPVLALAVGGVIWQQRSTSSAQQTTPTATETTTTTATIDPLTRAQLRDIATTNATQNGDGGATATAVQTRYDLAEALTFQGSSTGDDLFDGAYRSSATAPTSVRRF